MASTPVGLSFTNSHCVVALAKDDRSEVIANESGERTTPALVSFTEDETLSGYAAKQGIVRNARKSVGKPLAFLGLKHEDDQVKASLKGYPYARSQAGKDGMVEFLVPQDEGDDKTVTPQTCLNTLCNTMKATAKGQTKGTIDNVVITCSHEFAEDRRKYLIEACKQAGMAVTRIVTEPTAAIIAYGLHNHHVHEHHITRDEPRANYLVVNIGGTESSCTVMASDQGLLREVSHETSNSVSATHFNKVLIDLLSAEFKKVMRVDISSEKRAQMKLAMAAERARRALYKQASVPASIDGLHEGVDLNCSVPRAKYEAMSQSVAKHASDLIAKALKSANLSPKAIAKVVYVGDGAHSKKLLDGLHSSFGADNVLSHIAGEEAFALGACKHAVMMQGLDDTTDHIAASVSVKALAHDVGMVDTEGKLQTLVGKGTPVPYLFKTTFALPKDQTSLKLTLAEQRADAVVTLATLRMPQVGAVDGAVQATLSLSFDDEANGVVRLTSPGQTDLEAVLEA
eukprot:m.219275 g.219275  ORF g.219275 m.219275 type:complete len:513 (-) comp17229_c0_seq8:46-1584(-)